MSVYSVPLHLSVSSWEVVCDAETVTFVYPDIIHKEMDLHTLYEITVWNDELIDDVYSEIERTKSSKPEGYQENEDYVKFFFYIDYLRNCRVKDVSQREWNNTYDLRNANEFIKRYNGATRDSVVKVIRIKPNNFDLKSLNNEYGQSPVRRRRRTY